MDDVDADDAPPPAKRAKPQKAQQRNVKLCSARVRSDTWETAAPVPYPGSGELKLQDVRYYTEEDGVRKFWLFNGRNRVPICACKPDGMCGLKVSPGTPRAGYAHGCAAREDRKSGTATRSEPTAACFRSGRVARTMLASRSM